MKFITKFCLYRSYFKVENIFSMVDQYKKIISNKKNPREHYIPHNIRSFKIILNNLIFKSHIHKVCTHVWRIYNTMYYLNENEFAKHSTQESN